MKLLVFKCIIGYFFVILPLLALAQTQHVERRDSLNETSKWKEYNLQSGDMKINDPRIIAPESRDIHPIFSDTNGLAVPDFRIPQYVNPVTPFHLYSYRSTNPIEGFSIQGMYNRFAFGNFLTADVDLFVSGYYNGVFQSHPYVNGSIKVGLTLRIHDRVQLVGMGQISLREGIDPKVPSIFGGANYYGGGIQFKVTNKIGFGIGVTNSYYRGSWTKQTYFTPVGY